MMTNSTEPGNLSVVLIVPNPTRRLLLATALGGLPLKVAREFGTYPSESDISGIVRLGNSVVIVDLDEDIEVAIRTIESIGIRNPTSTVMAYSSRNDSTLMRRSMQAGAREFLVTPFLPGTLVEAFGRTFSRSLKVEKAAGKILVFLPSKGGVGVTTIATNFALSLVKESGGKVVVVDLDFQLGEVALSLGITAGFSVLDALQNPTRLDKEFLSTLLVRHSSGLTVLSAPQDFSYIYLPPDEGSEKLFRILRAEFDYVVVDIGSCRGNIQEMLYSTADKLYLVTELSFPSLRNAHRLISFLSSRDGSRGLEVVINRTNSRHSDIDENSATKALGRPINWRLPNAYTAARAAQDSGIPLAMEDSAVTRVLIEMAKAACGKPVAATKKGGRGFSLFGLRDQLAADN